MHRDEVSARARVRARVCVSVCSRARGVQVARVCGVCVSVCVCGECVLKCVRVCAVQLCVRTEFRRSNSVERTGTEPKGCTAAACTMHAAVPRTELRQWGRDSTSQQRPARRRKHGSSMAARARENANVLCVYAAAIYVIDRLRNGR